MERNLKIMKVNSDGSVEPLGREAVITQATVGKAKRDARVLLEGYGFRVRSINAAESGDLLAYVMDREDPPKRGKPVMHAGPVGRNRTIRRRT